MGPPAKHMAFRLPTTQLEKDGWWSTLPYLGMLGWRDYLPPKDFQGVWDYRVVWFEEMVALAMALQRCAIHSGMPQGSTLWNSTRAPQMPHPSTWEGWSARSQNVGCSEEGPHNSCTCRKGLTTETQSRRTQSVHPPLMSHPLWSPEVAAQSEELAMVQRRRPPAPPWFTLSWSDESGNHPLEEAEWTGWAYPGHTPGSPIGTLPPWGPCR